ncbi:MAG: GNAT family protein, partial [Rhodospirillaceae bacterium]
MIRLLGAALGSGPAVRLQGRRVVLRPPETRDWSVWAALRARSRAFLTPWEPAWPVDSLTRSAFNRRVRRQMAEWRDDLTYSFLSFERETGALVGGLGLGNIRRGVSQTGTVGYWVGEPYARRGYTTEAVALV